MIFFFQIQILLIFYLERVQKMKKESKSLEKKTKGNKTVLGQTKEKFIIVFYVNLIKIKMCNF